MHRSGESSPAPGQDESDADRLRRTTTPEALSVELVSAFAGDREMTDAEAAQIRTQERNRGEIFYSDLLYSISHHYFAPEVAEVLWAEVLDHKRLISERLGRNVRITVAALDYLSNITSELRGQTLISETHVSDIVNLSLRDGMTGLFNHSTCHELLELEVRSHQRYGVGVAVLLLDIDDFKGVNDRDGHQEGDRILVALAGALKAEARDSDVCCRLGGDEFAVILRLTGNPTEACDIAERIRARAGNITSAGQPITVSVGVALCDLATASPEALVARADRALYEAKSHGKNRVVLDRGRA